MQEFRKQIYSLFTSADLICFSQSLSRTSKLCIKLEKLESKQRYNVCSNAKDFYLRPILGIPHLGLFYPELLRKQKWLAHQLKPVLVLLLGNLPDGKSTAGDLCKSSSSPGSCPGHPPRGHISRRQDRDAEIICKLMADSPRQIVGISFQIEELHLHLLESLARD